MTARLLVVADPKMLPALAGGLREAGKFEVVAVSLADAAAAQAAAANADAIAVFYGGPGAPLPAALQVLAPKVRDRGARVIAVLQREQAAQRDECFRAGASDLLFMPIPKDQFVARLAAAVFLAFPAEPGATAAVAVATRSSSSRIDNAKVSPIGVEAAGQLPFKSGDTVRLSWDSAIGNRRVPRHVQHRPARMSQLGRSPRRHAWCRRHFRLLGRPLYRNPRTARAPCPGFSRATAQLPVRPRRNGPRRNRLR